MRLILAGFGFAAIAVLLAPVAQAMHWSSGFWTERPVDVQTSNAGTNASGGFDWADAGIVPHPSVSQRPNEGQEGETAANEGAGPPAPSRPTIGPRVTGRA